MTAVQPIDQRRNPPIEEALEASRQRLARGETIETCLAAFPAHATELARLLPLVVQTQQLARDPSPAHAAAARRRFQAAVAATRAARQAGERAGGRFGWLKRLAVPAILVLVLTLSGAGLVQVSANNDVLPDSPLYPVKQTQERFAQFFQRTPDARLTFKAKLIERRVGELEAAESLHKPPYLVRLIATNMVTLTNQATDEIAASPEPLRSRLVQRARPLLARELRDLQRADAIEPRRLDPAFRQLARQVQVDQQKLASP